jgi:hypothetical protein
MSAASSQQVLNAIPAPSRTGTHQVGRTFVGTARNSGISVAIVVRGNALAGYLCDGKNLGAWSTGTLGAGNRIRLRSKRGALIDATLGGATVVGKVTLPGGRSLAFTATRAVDGQSGLFRQRNARLGSLSGWIVTASSIRGIPEDSSGKVKNGIASATPTTSSGGAGRGLSPADKAKACKALGVQDNAVKMKIFTIASRGPLSVKEEEELGFLQSSIILIEQKEEKAGCFVP